MQNDQKMVETLDDFIEVARLKTMKYQNTGLVADAHTVFQPSQYSRRR